MPLRRLAVAGLAGLALVFAGCATPNEATPAGVVAGEFDVDAAWLDGGRMVGIVTHGSSSCAPIAADVAVGEDGALEVTLEDPEAEGCTDDLVPRVALVGVPEGLSVTDGVEIRVWYGIDGWGETDLDAYDGGPVEPYTASAGVVDDDLIAVLTWGSSSCAPVVASAEFDGQITHVVFETPASDQVCTMDMAVRVTTASGFNVGEAAEVTLSGGAEFTDPLTIPLAG